MKDPIYIYFVTQKQRHGKLDLITREIADGLNIDSIENTGDIAGIEILDYTDIMIDGESLDDLLVDTYNRGYEDGVTSIHA